jgi:hypothetical protein
VGSRGRESERAAAAAAAIEERERESKSSIRRQRSLRWLLTIASFREARAGHARERGSGEREREQYEQQGEPRVLCLLELAIAGG